MNTEKPSSQRPEHPDFWCQRFGAGVTPWDAGGVPCDLARFASTQSQPLNTLIPGCGSGWEAAYLANLGWTVTALDFSPVAIDKAKSLLGDSAVNLVCGDFFQYAPTQPLDLIYERAFLCALPRKLWSDWGKQMAQLLPSGGLLAGYFFVCEQLKGPPFGIQAEELNALLNPAFEQLEDTAVDDSIPVFSGRERWQVWRRR